MMHHYAILHAGASAAQATHFPTVGQIAACHRARYRLTFTSRPTFRGTISAQSGWSGPTSELINHMQAQAQAILLPPFESHVGPSFQLSKQTPSAGLTLLGLLLADCYRLTGMSLLCAVLPLLRGTLRSAFAG